MKTILFMEKRRIKQIFFLILFGALATTDSIYKISQLTWIVCILGSIQVLFMQFIAGGMKDIENDYKKKIRELKDDYERKIQLHLDNEVKKKFRKKLNKKLLSEKARLEHRYSLKSREKLKEKLDEEKKKLSEKIHKEYNDKLREKLGKKIKDFNNYKKNFNKKLYAEFQVNLHKEVDTTSKILIQ